MIDQKELELLSNVELQRLHRQHNLLDLELQSLLKEKSKLLKRQSHIINLLEIEHQDLRDKINSYECSSHTKHISQREGVLRISQKKSMSLQQAFQNEHINFWELEGHLKKIKKEIDCLHKNELPENCYKDIMHKVQKSTYKLENRLDVVNKKCSEVITENYKLRRFINHTLQDRTHFNKMWQAMVVQFNEGKKYIIDLIDQSTLAYDQRAELCNKLQLLKDRTENDKIVHVQEMREMQRRLEQEAKLQEFFDIKGQKRYNLELDQRELEKKQTQKENFERQLTEYKSIIYRMKALYNESDVTALASQFKTQEEETFALFNYVNELSYEVEVLNDTTQQMRIEIDQQFHDQTKQEKDVKAEAVQYLSATIENIKKKDNKTILTYDSLSEGLKYLLQGVDNIFSLICCNKTPILNVLSSQTSLTVHNVRLFIGVIERRINLIMSNIYLESNSVKLLAKKDRVPKFNVKESVKIS